jgi:hypothetical protein
VDTIRRAWAFVAPDALLIAIVSVLPVVGTAGFYPEFSVPLALLMIPVFIVIYGRILARIVPGESPRAGTILATHTVNWMVVSVLVAALYVVITMGLAALKLPASAWFVAGVFSRIVVWVATMYALPLAFLMRRSLTAWLGGFVFLRRHRAASAPLAWVLLGTALLSTFSSWLFRVEVSPFSFTLAVVVGVVGSLLNFTIFAAALGNLIATGVVRVEEEGQAKT